MEQLKNLGFPTIALILGGIMLFLSITKKIDTKIGKATITTKKQQLQLGIGGALLIVSSFILQFYTPATNSETPDPLTAAQETISALETLAAVPTATPNVSPITTTTITPTPDEITNAIAITPSLTLVPSQTSSAPMPTPVTAQEFCVNFYSVIVRTDPGSTYPIKSILENPNNISDPVCLLFDFRMPDNSWVRIALDQETNDYSEHELGWIPADNIRPNDIDVLRIYIPDGVQNGRYCPTSRNGVFVRSCPGNGCEITGTLLFSDCLFIDARSQDNLWVRISNDQEESKYSQFSGHWINAYYIAPFELSAEWNPFIQYYLTAFPVVTPLPTPGG